MKVLQDTARRSYYRTLQGDGTAGHYKTKVLQDIARRRYYKTLQDEGTTGHCKVTVLQDIARRRYHKTSQDEGTKRYFTDKGNSKKCIGQGNVVCYARPEM